MTGRPPTVNAYVLAELRKSIATGGLPPGRQVRQDAFAEELSVSRVPIREALKILEGEGLVSYEPHRGYFVTKLSLGDLREVYRIRELLEAEAITEGTPKLSGADIERLTDLSGDIERCAVAEDIAGMTTANRQFHFTLFGASAMPRLIRLLRVLWDATDAYRSLYYTEPGNRDRVCAEHTAMIAAARSGDADAVVRLAATHRVAAVQALAAVVGITTAQS